MAERIKNLGLRDEIIGGGRSSGFDPSSGSGIQTFLAGFEAIARNEKAEKIQAERAKEKALKTYLDTMKTTFTTDLDVIANESPRNPQAIVKKATALRDGVVNAVPPAVRPLLIAGFDSEINLKRVKANEAATKEIQAQAKATEELRASQDFALLNEDSEGLYSNDLDVRNASESSVRAKQLELENRMSAQGIDDFGVPFDLHTKEEKTAELQEFTDVSQSAALKAWFREQPIPAEAYLQLLEGGFKIDKTTSKRTGKEGIVEETIRQVDVMNTLSPKAHDDLLRDIESEMKGLNDIVDNEEEQEAAEIERGQAINLLGAYESILNPNSTIPKITPAEILDLTKAGEFDSEKAVALLRAATNPPKRADDPLFLRMITTMSSANLDISDFLESDGASEKLTPSTHWRLIKENKANQEKLAGIIENDQDALIRREGKSLERTLTITSPFLPADPGVKFQEETRKADALTEFNRRAEEAKDLPVKEFAEFTAELRRELAQRGRVETLASDGFTGALLKPRFMTMKREEITRPELQKGANRLTDKFKSGKISREEYLLQQKIYLQWDERLIKKEKFEQESEREETKGKTNAR